MRHTRRLAPWQSGWAHALVCGARDIAPPGLVPGPGAAGGGAGLVLQVGLCGCLCVCRVVTWQEYM